MHIDVSIQFGLNIRAPQESGASREKERSRLLMKKNSAYLHWHELCMGRSMIIQRRKNSMWTRLTRQKNPVIVPN